jgi:hypothetical protein
MARTEPIDEKNPTLQEIARALNAQHDCTDGLRTEVRALIKLQDQREENREARHNEMTKVIEGLTKWIERIDRRQEKIDAQGVAKNASAPPDQGLLGMSRTTWLTLLSGLLVGFFTGPVGYYLWLKVIPAAIHGALTVAP